MKQPSTRPLAMVVAFHGTWIVAVFMALSAVMDAQTTGEPILSAFARHGVHTLVLAAAFFVVFGVVTYLAVMQPIHAVNVRLYRLAAGDTDLPPVNSRITEIRELEEGIERMRLRMHIGAPGEMRTYLEAALYDLRHIAEAIQPKCPNESTAILENVVRLGECLGTAQKQIDRRLVPPRRE